MASTLAHADNCAIQVTRAHSQRLAFDYLVLSVPKQTSLAFLLVATLTWMHACFETWYHVHYVFVGAPAMSENSWFVIFKHESRSLAAATHCI